VSGSGTAHAPTYDIVVPTIGRRSLHTLIEALDAMTGPPPQRVVIVDDRASPTPRLDLPPTTSIEPVVVAGRSIGPAAARNDGWRRCTSPWIVFLDDDVVPGTDWRRALSVDLAAAGPRTAAVTASITVPLPSGRRPTDAERGVAGLETAWCITADLAVRRDAIVALGGFDERFQRAYREDTDFALRLLDGGWEVADGTRRTEHPPRTGTWATSVRAQRGNADDALMRRLHGSTWRERGRAPWGTLRRHVLTTSMAFAVPLAAVAGARRIARLAAAAVAVSWAGLWWARSRPGPRTSEELARMAASSALIPFAATWWAACGWLRARWLAPMGRADRWRPERPRAVLFDRDGTLIHDVAYNADAALVRPVDGARESLDRLRSAGIATAIVTNQSGVGRGLIDRRSVDGVNERVDQLLGPFATIEVCEHAPDAGCACRKPAPGMIFHAAATLGVEPSDCALIGDIGADVQAAVAAGARAVLVPTAVTRQEEIASAPETAATLDEAVGVLLDGRVVRRQAMRSADSTIRVVRS
jgi:histidinol-phosphate phosphatase family protein